MTKEYLAEQKTKYQEKHDYFKKIGFDALATDFQNVIDLIKDMEKCVEKQTTQND